MEERYAGVGKANLTPLLLELRDVWYSYPHPEAEAALRGIDLSINRGEWVGVTGRGGSGKSTLGRLCAGLLRPQAGTAGGPVLGDAAWVAQDPADCLLGSTVGEDIAFGLIRLGLDRGELAARIESCLATVGLPAHFQYRDPDSLSGGERQRVAIAAALSLQRPLVILDEPFAMLDGEARALLLAAIGRLRRDQRVSFLHISHDWEELAEADRVLVMDQGRVLGDSPPAELLALPAIRHLLGDDLPALSALAAALPPLDVALPPLPPAVAAWTAALSGLAGGSGEQAVGGGALPDGGKEPGLCR